MLISREFFHWARDASATQRAAGAASLICDYLHMELTAEEKAEVESVLTSLLDDPAPVVRRALAEGFAREAEAPRHILSALAADQPEIAALTLGCAPFSPGELAEAVLNGGAKVHIAIARRRDLHRFPADVLAAEATDDALVALAENESVDLSETAMLAMVERAGDCAALREALLRRARLPLVVRERIAAATGGALADFLGRTGWLPPERAARVVREARENVVVGASVDERGAQGAAASLARHLRSRGQLTPALLIRSLLTGDSQLFNASVAELTQIPLARAAMQVETPEGPGFAALYTRAGLPAAAQPVFVALLRGIAEDGKRGARAPLRRLADRAIEACAAMPEPERGRISTLIRRIEADAARDESRTCHAARG